jgi:Flp pilus assembly protein TadD
LSAALPALLISVYFSSCTGETTRESPVASTSTPFEFLNHHDSARYVGMATCRQCHQGIYETFIRTGMGKSIGVATRERSAADFSRASVSDPFANLRYRAFWQADSMYMQEYRLSGRDTVHERTEKVSHIIGSGQHTNSHLSNFNGYIHQMPMTYYTQKKKWDLPPGFENGVNTRFSRKIGLECMSCHNALPDFVLGSENKFTRVPGGIDCERCHGPGSIHVNARRTQSPVDTANETDRTIVNPAKLAIEKQFDVCQRCHLQGNAVLREGKSFYDFRPGLKLSDFITVFMPKFEGAEDEFIMASHAERLKMSPCFTRSAEKAGVSNSLRPYKGAMTCVTCHNPHVSVKETGNEVFNRACTNCHGAATASVTTAHRTIKKWGNCITCHMPLSGATDIPHVTVHDHFIRKPVSRGEKERIRRFAGLHAVNAPSPDALTRANAYLNQYEKFGQEEMYLDSAARILSGIALPLKKIRCEVQLKFMRGDHAGIAALVNTIGERMLHDTVLVNKTYDNADAWCCYRIAESLSRLGSVARAETWFRKAVELAPYFPDFRNKLGAALVASKKQKEAVVQFEEIIRENPSYAPAYANLGYLMLMQGFHAEAIRLLNKGLGLDPDNVPVLLNLASYHIFNQEMIPARKYLKRVLALEPGNLKAKEALAQMRP